MASSSSRISRDPDTTYERDGDTASIAHTVSQLTLGEYHSSRLAVHDRSDTSSPSGVSTSEEDEEDNLDREDNPNPYRISIPSRRPATTEPYPRPVQARALWTSNSDEEINMDRDNVVAHKHGWKGSSMKATQTEGEGVSESKATFVPATLGEGDEAAANRLPNEIIMNVSSLIMPFRLARLISLDSFRSFAS